ncbi:MAG TPA: cation transporter [Gammaproteobacteria bacterium]|nr:cation transporter [Gammaproteobacteria bacterium]
MSGCGCSEQADYIQRSVLRRLLAINGFMFVVEVVVGYLAQSTAVVADSVDMLADAAVYGVALYAVGRGAARKVRAARISGLLQTALGGLVLADILRRLVLGSEPVSLLMMIMGSVALAANIYCLVLIAGHRHGEVHMRASWIFSRNDVIANLGVIGGGLLVWWLDSPYPDLVIGTAIAVLVIRGGLGILAEARREDDLIVEGGRENDG